MLTPIHVFYFQKAVKIGAGQLAESLHCIGEKNKIFCVSAPWPLTYIPDFIQFCSGFEEI